jgi:hypothetical protein
VKAHQDLAASGAKDPRHPDEPRKSAVCQD